VVAPTGVPEFRPRAPVGGAFRAIYPAGKRIVTTRPETSPGAWAVSTAARGESTNMLARDTRTGGFPPPRLVRFTEPAADRGGFWIRPGHRLMNTFLGG